MKRFQINIFFSQHIRACETWYNERFPVCLLLCDFSFYVLKNTNVAVTWTFEILFPILCFSNPILATNIKQWDKVVSAHECCTVSWRYVGQVKVNLCIFLTLAVNESEWSATCCDHLPKEIKKPQYPMNMRLDGPQSQCRGGGKLLCLLEVGPRSSSP